MGLKYEPAMHPPLLGLGLRLCRHLSVPAPTRAREKERKKERKRERDRERERERELCIDDQLLQIHFITEMIQQTILSPWVFEYPVADSLDLSS